MDELEISGKRYISSRRAAKEHHYHTDYIGQLIRGRKIKGTKVGRAWYVEEDSLRAYLQAEHTQLQRGEQPHAGGKVYEYEISHAARISESAHESRIPIQSNIAPAVPIFVGLRYLSDDEPQSPIAYADSTTVEEHDNPTYKEAPMQPHIARMGILEKPPAKTHRTVVAPSALFIGAVLGLVVFIAAAYASLFGHSTLTVEQGKGQSASILEF